MKNYIGRKFIKAEPMTRGEFNKSCGVEIPTSDANYNDNGYRVIYSDGYESWSPDYESWSPKDVFEEAYHSSGDLNFGDTIYLLKKGFKVARTGWNGKGMFLYYVPAASYPPSTSIAKDTFNGEDVPYGAYIAMKTAQGNVVPWLASQTDVLAEDWVIVE